MADRDPRSSTAILNGWGKLMMASRLLLAALGLCGAVFCTPGSAVAQANQWDKPVDLKAFVPPVVPLPPSAKLNPSNVGGAPGSNTTVQPQTSNAYGNDPAPGFKLTIPTR